MKLYKILIALLFLTISSFAEIIENIEITGNKRLSKESILVFTKIDLNNNYESNDLNNILKNLYDTNFFEEVHRIIRHDYLKVELDFLCVQYLTEILYLFQKRYLTLF